MSLFTLINTVRIKRKRRRKLTFSTQLKKEKTVALSVAVQIVSQHSLSRKHRDDEEDDEDDKDNIIIIIFIIIIMGTISQLSDSYGDRHFYIYFPLENIW